MPHDAFLRSIIENPDDDSRRLVYADWLDGRGDPRGEFIRVQCELARLSEVDPRRAELEARERRLPVEYQEWAEPLRGLARRWEFRRGFVEVIDRENALNGLALAPRPGPGESRVRARG